MNKVKDFINKIRVEFFMLGSLLMTIIGFCTNYYFGKFNGIKAGVSIFDNIFDADIGWLFFLIILGGYITSIVFCSLDNQYSKRTKLSFLATVGFTAFMFLILVLWVIFDNDFIFKKQQYFGSTLSGGFGFAFYWFIIHFVATGFILLFYKEYTGSGEVSVFHWILSYTQNNNTNGTPKPKQTTDKYTELKKVKELFDEGVLTEEEYINEKQSILDKYK